MFRFRHVVMLIAALTLVSGTALAGEETEFPEMEAFDDLMREAMHGPVEDADIDALIKMYPDFAASQKALEGATLPEGYADVAEDYDKALKNVDVGLDQYGEAVEKKDGEEMVDAVLALHHATTRVDAALKGICYEVVELHDAIAPIQHRALPNENWAAIAEACPELEKRIAALKTAEMPAKHADAKDDLVKQADLMEVSLAELEKACAADDPKAIESAFSDLHDHFHSCMELFQ